MTTITNPKILIVEDEAIIAEDISASLKRLGCRVTSMASTGAQAIEMTANDRPDLILMDITLQGPIDGIETAERLRTQDRIPVVYLSGNSDQKTLDRARLTEPFGYLLKPFKEKELQSTIEMALFKNVREERLRKSERWLASTLHDMGDGVITTGLDNVVTFMNPIAERLTGYAAGEALGRPAGQVLQLFHEETKAAIEVPTAAAILQGGPVDLPGRTMLSDGNWLGPFAYIAVGTEANIPPTYRLLIPALVENYGFSEYNLEFLTEHVGIDDRHGLEGAMLIESVATTDEARRQALEGARRGGVGWWEILRKHAHPAVAA